MDSHSNFQREMNYAALFVDFDNVYLNLLQHDNEAANEFARNPGRWLRWLETKLPSPFAAPLAAERRILIRRCYLNPLSFGNFRPQFTLSAFEVIDCPPLTARGKTSTDIHMVMDILDALDHPTYFNQFIILSGDADFTPVMLRIRKQGRYSVALSVGYVSPAYKAACDIVISQEDFITNALGLGAQEEEKTHPIDDREISASLHPLLDEIAVRLKEEASAPGGVEASELPAIYKEFSQFKQSNHWLGFYSLRRLTEAILACRNDLVIVEDDPWRVTTIQRPQPLAAPAVIGDGEPARPATGGDDTVRARIAAWIKQVVDASPTAVPLATLAQQVRVRFNAELSDTMWLGAETFKGLLLQLDLGHLLISSAAGGLVLDPARHQLSNAAVALTELAAVQESGIARDTFAIQYPDIAPLARRIHQLTDTPYLTPENYALVFQELAREVTENGYQMTRVSRTVRDRCVERGASIARATVNFVLIGIYYSGYRFGHEAPEDPAELAAAFVQNTINLCGTAQLELTDDDLALLHRWIAGAVPGLAPQ